MIKTKKQGLMIVISGPSGCGKGTIIDGLKEKNDNLWESVSLTSRPMRSNDIKDVTYYFVSREEFEKKVEDGELLEYTIYSGNYYGTPKTPILEHLEKGNDVILEIEIEGALKMKEIYPSTIFIFILPPTMKELKRRLDDRNTDSEEKRLERFQRAYEEINELPKYNYVVVNDNIEEAIAKVNAILISERCRVDRIEEVELDTKEEALHEELLPNKDMPDQEILKELKEELGA